MLKRIFLLVLVLVLVLPTGCIVRRESSDDDDDSVYIELKRANETVEWMEDMIDELKEDLEKGQEKIKDLSERVHVEPVPVRITEADYDPLEGLQWTLLESYSYDINDDRQDDEIKLYTSALKDDKGVIMWDDGQHFLLTVKIDDELFILFNERVQLGRVYFTVNGEYDSKAAGLFIMVPTFSGINLYECSFDADENGFLKRSVFSSEDTNIVHSTLPWD